VLSSAGELAQQSVQLRSEAASSSEVPECFVRFRKIDRGMPLTDMVKVFVRLTAPENLRRCCRSANDRRTA
jgi:hypothetical protein